MKRIHLRQHLSDIWYILKPNNFSEQCIFILLLIYFVAIATGFCLIALPQEQSFWIEGRPQGMLGYDTAGHLTYEPMMISTDNILNWNIRHPLYRLLFLPVILINEGLLYVGINITWPLFLATSTWFMSSSGLYIFKTLRTLGLSILNASLLILLYGSFAHTIMLSIQVDSFVPSMFFCSAMTLLFVRHYHNKLTDNLLFLGIAGTTSTNFIKFALYQLLEEHSIKKSFIRFIQSIGIFCVLFVLIFPDLVIRLIERPRGFLYAVMGDSFYYQGSDINKWHLFIDNFVSDPLLFHHTTGIIFSNETILLPSYPSVWFYMPIAIIFLLVIISVVVNWRKPVIHLFCCCIGFDLFMHFGIGYGIEEGQLFCGHWLFFIPIVIGLLTTLDKSIGKITQALILTITLFLLTTNLYHLCQSFYNFTA